MLILLLLLLLLCAEKLHRRDVELSGLMSYIRHTHADRLHGYDGDNVDEILRLLQRHDTMTSSGGDRGGVNHTTLHTPNSFFLLPNATPTSATTTVSKAVLFDNAVTSFYDDDNSGNKTSFGDVMGRTGGNSSRRRAGTYGGYGDEHGDDGANDDVTSMHDVAHGLHFASIAMLGLLVVEVSKEYIESVCRSPGKLLKIVYRKWLV